MSVSSGDELWTYRITFDDEAEDGVEIELKDYGNSGSECPDCGLKVPARLDYPSGNSFRHDYDVAKGRCVTKPIKGDSRE